MKQLDVHSGMRGRVNSLQAAMYDLPQIELPTTHHFADGMYMRALEVAAGSLIVGKVHKREHFFILAKGRMQVTTDNEVQTLTAPAVLVASAGTKRAGLALEDCLCLNVHRTDNIDLDAIENELIEPDDLALFDSANKLKGLL